MNKEPLTAIWFLTFPNINYFTLFLNLLSVIQKFLIPSNVQATIKKIVMKHLIRP